MATRARGKASPTDVAERDASEREVIEYEIALRDVALRVREVSEGLERVRLWVSGRLKDSLTDEDLRALDEGTRHFKRLQEKVERRIGA